MRSLDKNQQAAVDIRKNAVVTAGAGAGKTTVLSQRYLDIVKKQEAGVEEILTLTFTQKAAAEMKERIYNTLIASKDDPFIASQLDSFAHAQISTIDSFCSEVARAGAAGLGINPDFVSDQKALRQKIKDLAQLFVFKNADSKAIQTLLLDLKFDPLVENLLVDLGERYFSVAEPIDFEADISKQFYILTHDGRKYLEYIQDVLQSCKQYDSGDSKFLKDLEAIELRDFDWSDQKLSSINLYLEHQTEFLSQFKKLSEQLETLLSLRKPSSRSKKDGALYVLEIVDDLKSACTSLNLICRSLANLEHTNSIAILFSEFQEQVLNFKRDSGILSFGDIMDISIAVLKSHKDIRSFYKNKFKFIMVDEFQDNNKKQKDLLYLLAEKQASHSPDIPSIENIEDSKLFFVGDEKQSIYKFRGADVSVFKGLAHELLNNGGAEIVLDKNYRSEPKLIRWFNSVFEKVFDDSEAAYEASFQSLGTRTQDHEPDVDIEVMIQEPAEHDGLSSVECEAWNIAQYIQDCVTGKRGMVLADGKGGTRLPEYRDFALLMRSTGSSRYYEGCFRHCDIPYSSQEPRSLFLAAPINDLYHLFQLLLFPNDLLSQGAVLRSPYCKISDQGLLELMSAGGIWKHEPTGVDDKLLFNQFISFYNELKQLCKTADTVELFQKAWYEGGYFHYLHSQPSLQEHYEFIKEAASQYPLLGEFLIWMRPKLGQSEKLDEAKVFIDRTNAVELMTVHKSKGLEFPIVILAGASGEGKNQGAGTRPYIWDHEAGIAIMQKDQKGKAYNYFFSRSQELEKKKEEAELKRLLYVALTRAETHLLISGAEKQRVNKDAGSPSFMKMIIDALGEESLLIKKNPPLKEIMFKTKKTRQLPIPGTELEYELLLNKVSSLEGTFGTSTPIKMPSIESDPLIKGNENNFGTLCHRIIEYRIAGRLYGKLNPKDLEGFNFYQFTNIVDDQSQIEADAIYLSNNAFADDLYDMISTATSVHSEYSILLKTDQGVLRGTIDLLLEFDDSFILIDYKTDSTLDELFYAPQLAMYFEGVSALLNKPGKAYILNLRDGKLRPVAESNGKGSASCIDINNVIFILQYYG